MDSRSTQPKSTRCPQNETYCSSQLILVRARANASILTSASTDRSSTTTNSTYNSSLYFTATPSSHS
ncbi:MAG: hypothetical protein ACK56F_18275, partial [bacterium]